MDDYCLEILDVDDDVHTRLHSKFLEVGSIDCDCCDKWMLQDFLPVRDLFCVALKYAASVFTRKNIEHFGLGTEIFSVLLHSPGVHAPPVFRRVAIEQCMHDVHGFICELVGLDDTLVADHLDDESTLRLGFPLLHTDFTAIDRTITP